MKVMPLSVLSVAILAGVAAAVPADYELTRTDDRSIGSAVSAFLSNSVLEELMTPEGTDNL